MRLRITPVVALSYLSAVSVFSSAATSLTPSGGTPQSAAVGTVFATALQATVRDASGNPVNGVTVTFTAPPSGASAVLSGASAVTNASGVASVTANANNTAGTYTVAASVGVLSASFSLTNNPSAGGSTNLALGKLATQSSTLKGYPSAIAASAVDGNADGAFFDGSVSTTDLDPSPAWWEVDLGASASISSVVIWNRTDCCGSRLDDFWVFVSDTPFLATDTPATLQFRAGTFNSHQTSAPNPSTTINAGTQGRYVRVQLTGTNYLSLAEVQVFSPAGSGVGPTNGANLAQGKPATQSSTLPGTPAAGVAVDGNTDGAFFDGSVSVTTNLDPNPWWQVDLGTSTAIASIVIWNRTDCCASRLDDYWVFVSDTPFLATDTPATLQLRAGTFNSHQTAAPNPSTTINAGTQGRYVRVQLTNRDYLTLAEVQVFAPAGSGVPAPPAPGPTSGAGDLGLHKSATQSSTLVGSPTASAASAVDGNTDGAFSDGSVSITTNLDPNAWWQVDLGASTTIGSIVIWNRTDCCGSQLNDYWVFVSDTPFLPDDTPATLRVRAGTFRSHRTAAPNPFTSIMVGTHGQYVRVQLTSPGYLSLAEVQVFAPIIPDLAQGKTAAQSSTLAGSGTTGAGAAVDGNMDGTLSDGSVTATNLDSNPWWQVDLGASMTIGSIAIWNRTDCCEARLSDYWVFVSDTPFSSVDTPATLQFRAGTFSSHQTAAPNPSTYITAITQGRYVRVQLTGANYLSLAEVQVLPPGGPPPDLALSGMATQSSTLPGFSTVGASAAADDNTDGMFFDGSVATTNTQPNAWWQVDLGASANVSSIVVWNRTDCCGSSLSDFWVFVSDTPFSPTDTPATLQFRAGTWSSHQTVSPNPAITIPSGAEGRYVRVQLTGADYLSLAEVQVFGTFNLAFGKVATQSSTIPGTPPPGAAVDGNTDGVFSDGSVTATTNAQPNAWWQVDLGASAPVSSIVIWNRTDCCGTRLGDYWVFVSDTPFLLTDTPSTLQARPGTFASHQMVAPNPSTTITANTQGRYVRVQLNGADYLSLAEVQVISQ